jgi:hypothetical protein
MALNMTKAKKNNTIYASITKPPWKDRFYQISEQLGIYNQTPTAEAFAQAVYQWQISQPGMSADGILGPGSWAKLEPRTRYSIDFGAPPEWVTNVPDSPKSTVNPFKNNGITDYLDKAIEKNPSFKTTLINANVGIGSWGLGYIAEKLGEEGISHLKGIKWYGAAALIQPIIWAVQGNTGDAGDKLLWLLGAIPPLGLAAGITGVWKGLMDDDVLDKHAEVVADEGNHLAKYIFPTATYSRLASGILPQRIAQDGGVSWQHPNGLWVFIKAEQEGKMKLMCDYKPKNAVKIVGPELPLHWTGSGFAWRSYKGGF